MYHQTIVGKPKNCLNRICKHPFSKESHLGWMPKSEIEVLTVMRCMKCKDTFAVVQLISMADEYKNNLPSDITKTNQSGPISKKEINLMRKRLETKDNLKNLFEGYKPNASNLPSDDKD